MFDLTLRRAFGRDYISVPQVGSYYNPDELTELMKSVNSIPAYIERCDYFLVVCPTIEHADMQNVICDYGSWTRRGLREQARVTFHTTAELVPPPSQGGAGSSKPRSCSRVTTSRLPSS